MERGRHGSGRKWIGENTCRWNPKASGTPKEPPAAALSFSISYLGAGYCEDFKYLPEGKYPPHLAKGKPLYRSDKQQECAARCYAEGSGFGDTAFYLNLQNRCACSKGACSERKGASQKTKGLPTYKSFRMKLRALLLQEETEGGLVSGTNEVDSSILNETTGVSFLQLGSGAEAHAQLQAKIKEVEAALLAKKHARGEMCATSIEELCARQT